VGRDAAIYRSVLPAVPAAGAGRAVLLTVRDGCDPVRLRSGGAASADGCLAPTVADHQVGAYGLLELPQAGAVGAVQSTGRAEVAAVAEGRGAAGWWSYGPAVESDASGQLAFPVAIAPDLRPELWITNQHPTATTQISLVMFDGNRETHRLYDDPSPLCPGATRSYDVAELAGEVPPTSGRGGSGPPMLSLRAQSFNPALGNAAPPIAGAMVLSSSVGSTAYAGFSQSPVVVLGRALRGLRDVQLRTYVPVRRSAGEPALTTLLAITAYGTGPNENQFYIDVYDRDGALLAGEIGGALQGGAATFFDLGTARLPLPASFEGFAAVRGVQGYGQLAVLAVDRPAQADRPGESVTGDRLVSRPGLLLPRVADPSVPTPTTRPTLATTPTSGTPPVRPTRPAEATATTAAHTPAPLYLPHLRND
jgi:hypothetical protein